MRGKIKEKHSEKKSPGVEGSKLGEGLEAIPDKTSGAGSDLFPQAKGTEKISGEWASAVQIYAVTELTDAELRRLANPNNPNPKTGQAWIPKPVNGKYHYELTMAGIAQWALAKVAERKEHPVYDSMDTAETVGLIPVEFQKWAKKTGVKFINGNRTVQSEPLRRAACELLKKMFAKGAPNLAGIEGFEEWDPSIEMAKKLREERIKLEDDRELRQKDLVKQEVIEELFWEKWLGPARGKMQASPKNLKRAVRTILQAYQVPAEAVAKVEAKITEEADGLQKLLAELIPAKAKLMKEAA